MTFGIGSTGARAGGKGLDMTHLLLLGPWNGTEEELSRLEGQGLLISGLEDGTGIAAETVRRLLSALAQEPKAPRSAPPHRPLRRFRAGERIALDPENVLEIQEGIVALTVIHEDGAEVLLGLYGPGQVLTGHPEDHCCIQLQAHTDTAVRIGSWTEAAQDETLVARLRDRLRHMEAWAAMQARPQIEQRLLGILTLLAEQFGRPAARGTLVDVRVTHAQLASAVGATRTTVTRLLGQLRRQGALALVQAPGGERFCLRDWDGRRHGA